MTNPRAVIAHFPHVVGVLALAGLVVGCESFTSPSGVEVIEPTARVSLAPEAAPAAAPVPTPTPRPAVPAPEPTGEQVAARHILIQFQGSARAGAEITRTKEEAQAIAAGLAEQAGAEGADFEALAREHSDGPSGPRGGDLGTFGRRRMHPAFEAGAFDLEVGAVSGVVETPFGFHIIQRYE